MKTRLHCYRFDISKPDETAEYEALCAELERMGLRKFDYIPTENYKFREFIKALDGQEIPLELDYLFDNQWNTGPVGNFENGFRAMDWDEPIYPNRDIKSGYYLEQTQGMKDARVNRVKCGYCGKQYHTPLGPEFCTACLGSEYLKESELYLLRLEHLQVDYRKKLSADELDYLLPLYVEAQTRGNAERNRKRKESLRKRVELEFATHQMEYEGYLWLLNHDINTENCIFYNHRSMFTFGWQRPLEPVIVAELRSLLEDFPYAYEIKESK